MRCQLYVECAVAGRMGMTIYVKPGAPIRPVGKSLPPLSFMAPIAPDMLALFVAQSSGGCSILVMFFTAILCFQVKDTLNPFELLLVLLHVTNLCLLCVRQWKFSHAASASGEHERQTPALHAAELHKIRAGRHYNCGLCFGRREQWYEN